MDEREIARVLDPEAWARSWSTLGEAIEVQTRCERTEWYARRLVGAGHSVVKLPDMVVDEGFKTWPVDNDGRGAHVWRKLSDGTTSLDGVRTSGMSPAQARSLAAALLAAAKYVEEERHEA